MYRTITRLATSALCGLSLFALAGAPAHAQDPSKSVFSARAADRVFIDVMIDSDRGTQFNEALTKSYSALIAGSEWQVLENGQFSISKNGKPLVAALAYGSEDNNWFLIHTRTPKLVVNGEAYRFSNEPEKGWATLFVTIPSTDGKSFATIRMGVPLSMTTQGDAPSDGGFGDFDN